MLVEFLDKEKSMMDSTLAQMLNHIVELEIERMQLKEEIEQLKSGERIATPPQETSLPAFMKKIGE